MVESSQLTPFPAAKSGSPPASWRQRWTRLSPLARDLIVVLVVKAFVLGILWFAFFRAPAAPRMAMDPQRVEQKVLAPSLRPAPPHAIR